MQPLLLPIIAAYPLPSAPPGATLLKPSGRLPERTQSEGNSVMVRDRNSASPPDRTELTLDKDGKKFTIQQDPIEVMRTLLIDLIERLTILETRFTFADEQRLEIMKGLREVTLLLGEAAKKVDVKAMEEQISNNKKLLLDHENTIKLGKAGVGIVWGAISGVAVLVGSKVFEWWIARGH